MCVLGSEPGPLQEQPELFTAESPLQPWEINMLEMRGKMGCEKSPVVRYKKVSPLLGKEVGDKTPAEELGPAGTWRDKASQEGRAQKKQGCDGQSFDFFWVGVGWHTHSHLYNWKKPQAKASCFPQSFSTLFF